MKLSSELILRYVAEPIVLEQRELFVSHGCGVASAMNGRLTGSALMNRLPMFEMEAARGGGASGRAR